MTRDEYIALPGLNFSRAKHLLRSAAHFKAETEDEEKETTEAQHIGTLAHAMVLEGKDLRSMFAVKPKGMSFANKEGKAWRSEQTLPILKEEDMDFVPAAADAISSDPHAAAILAGCPLREHGISGMMQGVQCKALLDLAGEGAGSWAIGDAKTCVDASPDGFSKAVFRSHYDMQIAWYADLLGIVEQLDSSPFAFWLAIEKPNAIAVPVYVATAQVLESGRRKVAKALDLYKRCLESGEWPAYSSGPLNLKVPKWAAYFGEEAA